MRQDCAQALVISHCPHISTASLSLLNKRWGVLNFGVAYNDIGLLVQPVPCSSRSYVGREGHWCLVYKYTWFIGCCASATWCNMPVPSSCRSLVAFNPLNLW